MSGDHRITVVASSDWHLDWTTAGMPRFDDVRARVIEEVLPAALAADVFVFAGDLTDPDTTRAHLAVSFACEVASRCSQAGVPSLWIAGNHDIVEDGYGTTMLSALRGVQVGKGMAHVEVFERPAATIIRTKRGEELPFVALPYPSRTDQYDPDDWVRKLDPPPPIGPPPIVAGHLWLRGMPDGGSESTEMGRGRAVWWPTITLREVLPNALLIAGHYHGACVHDGVHVIGDLERLTFGEAHNRPSFLRMGWGRA